MHLITYMSEVNVPHSQIEDTVQDIVKVAEVENARNDITGVLFFAEGKFLQVIEGKKEVLQRLMQNISNDPRHKNIDYLIDTPVPERGFRDWKMGSFILKKGHSFDPVVLAKLVDSYEKNILPCSNPNIMFFYKALVGEAA